MSQQEQDQLLGELIRKKKDATSTLAAIGLKLAKFVEVQGAVKQAVENGRIGEAIGFLNLAPEKGEIINTLTELQNKEEELRVLNTQLAKFGL